MRYSNLHTHTTFSDGRHTMEENVRSAIEKHMLSLGFSDHSFTGPDPSYCMHEEQYSNYLAEIAKLKEKYAHILPIYAGLEFDYYSDLHTIQASAALQCDDEKPFCGKYDYIIASVHYIIKDGICYPIDHSAVQQIDCIQNAFGGDVLAMAQCYFDLLCEHVERVRPTLVGHFDVITKFGLMPEDDEHYREIARRALKRVIQTCPYIEVNTGAIARGLRKTPYPSYDLLETILEEGGKVVLSSDSHHKDNLTFYFDETVELLKQAGFERIFSFNGTGFCGLEYEEQT